MAWGRWRPGARPGAAATASGLALGYPEAGPFAGEEVEEHLVGQRLRRIEGAVRPLPQPDLGLAGGLPAGQGDGVEARAAQPPARGVGGHRVLVDQDLR